MQLKWSMRIAAPCLVAALFASDAFAQRISVVTFEGPGANAVRNQVVSELCDRAECVPQAKVTTKGKIDWKKVKKAKVKFVVDGKVIAKGKKRSIEVQVLAKAGPGKKKTWSLEGGELSDRNLKTAGEVLGGMMGLPPKEAPEEKKPPPPEETKKPEEKPPPEEKPAAEEKPAPEEKKVTQPPPPPKEEEKPAEPEPEPGGEAPKKREKRPVVAVEVGWDLATKGFSYSQTGTPNLRSYSAPLTGPNLKAELYPLTLLFQDSVVSGLGAEVGFFTAINLKSRRSGSDVSYPTSISRFDVALKFQIRPSAKSAAYVSPIIGFRSHSFSVGPGSDMSVLDGLPAISYAALKFGLAGELPFGDTGLLVFGRFAVLPVLSAPEIISAKYFPNGSVLGIDGGLGLGLKLPFLKMLQVRLSFDFARYGLTFRTQPTDLYVAGGAVDQYLGGTLAVRLTY